MSVGIARIADGEPAERKRRDGRALLLNGARQLLAEKGYAGMELRDVAERGKAPRGSIYHHFPGGKAPARARGGRARGDDDPRPDRALAGGARPAGRRWRCSARSSAAASPTTPSGSAARSPPPPWPGPRTPSSPPPRPPPSRAGNGRSPRRCATKASAPADAEAFAGLVVSTVEGALLRARAAGSQEPLDSAIAGLGQALDGLLASAA